MPSNAPIRHWRPRRYRRFQPAANRFPRRSHAPPRWRGPWLVRYPRAHPCLKSIRATGTADDWFKALRAAPNAEAFHRQAKTPFGLSSPRDMGKLLEMMEKGEAVSQGASRQMLQIMRGQVYSSRLPRYVEGYRSLPHKTGDFMPYIGNDVGVLESQSRRVVLSVFTANHFGGGAALEDAIGRIAELAGNYFAARP